MTLLRRSRSGVSKPPPPLGRGGLAAIGGDVGGGFGPYLQGFRGETLPERNGRARVDVVGCNQKSRGGGNLPAVWRQSVANGPIS